MATYLVNYLWDVATNAATYSSNQLVLLYADKTASWWKKRKLVSIEPTAQLRQASQSKLNEMPTLEPGGQVWIGDKDRYGLVTWKT